MKRHEMLGKVKTVVNEVNRFWKDWFLSGMVWRSENQCSTTWLVVKY